MPILIIIAILPLLTVAAQADHFADLPGWSGGPLDDGGEIRRCVMSHGNGDGDDLMLALGEDGAVGIGVSGPQFVFAQGDPVTLIYRSTGAMRLRIEGSATAADTAMGWLPGPSFERYLASIARQDAVTIGVDGHTASFVLEDADLAIEQLLECVQAQLHR